MKFKVTGRKVKVNPQDAHSASLEELLLGERGGSWLDKLPKDAGAMAVLSTGQGTLLKQAPVCFKEATDELEDLMKKEACFRKAFGAPPDEEWLRSTTEKYERARITICEGVLIAAMTSLKKKSDLQIQVKREQKAHAAVWGKIAEPLRRMVTQALEMRALS